MRVFLVDQNNARRDAGAIKQVGGQADDAANVALADQVFSDFSFGVAAKQHAVRQNAGTFAFAFQRAHDVQQIGVVALLAGRCAKRKSLVRVFRRVDTTPALVAERRIGDDIVEGFECAVLGFKKRVGQRVALADFGGWVVVQDHVHAGEAGRRCVLLLPVNRDLGGRGVRNLEQ